MSLPREVVEILKESVVLARTVQPILEKQAAMQATCENRAEELVDTLIRDGVVPFEKRASLIRQLSDPIKAYDFIEKLASRIGPDNLAEPGDRTEVSQSAESRLMDWLMND